MIAGLTTADVLNALGGLVMVSLGGAILLVRPRRAANVAFAVFLIAWGAAFVAGNLAPIGSQALIVARRWDALAATVAALSLLSAAHLFPRPLTREERPWLLAPLLAGSIMGIAQMGVATEHDDVRSLAVFTLYGVMAGTAVLWARRTTVATDPQLRRQYAILAVAVGAPLQVPVAGWLINQEPGDVVRGLAGLATLIAAAGAWLVAGARGGLGWLGRNAAWGLLGVMVLHAMIRLWNDEIADGVPGVLRVAAAALVAYTIVRHQLLGFDVKLRWTLSKSTLAAAFIAVFFLASEGAQIVFGQENEIVGLFAAGALVFAIAPLQRAADRLAERAVPIPTAVAVEDPGHDRETAYREAVRLALRDRELSRAEERHLMRLAHHLRIPAPRAIAIHEEVEGERQADPRASATQGDG